MFTPLKFQLPLAHIKLGCSTICVLLHPQRFVHLSIGGVPGHCNPDSCNICLKLAIVGPDRNNASCLICPVPGQKGFSAWARAGACLCGVFAECCLFLCVLWVCGIRGGLRTTVLRRCALLGVICVAWACGASYRGVVRDCLVPCERNGKRGCKFQGGLTGCKVSSFSEALADCLY